MQATVISEEQTKEIVSTKYVYMGSAQEYGENTSHPIHSGD